MAKKADRCPLPKDSVFYPKKSHNGYYDVALGRKFYSKNEKRDYMNAHGLKELYSSESAKHRRVRIEDQCNEDREKRGKKPLTARQIFGDKYTGTNR